MYDFSKWSGLVVLQPEQRNIRGTLFSKINLTARTRFRCCLLTMGKKIRKNKKRVATGANYIPRAENSEKRHKRENITTSVLNKEGLPGTFAKTIWAKRSGGTLERLYVPERSYVSDVPPHIYMSLPRR